ncbi:SpoIID/LytB domain-containing protein [Alkaliphilus hydrothermalis]|uniref:Stage II sporulation protein D n=1 Tax=Alkaliphilus hydrothermalis TaxID=1482730 RepID=A0ABS2NLS1_9FIRM|nr:SpoIID/LytB domain-containing protein [Alkaliphilus hydrothermalis]MBM7613878.1 stage II sporulation protein D [Alkaliphilus hydrothermalis]
MKRNNTIFIIATIICFLVMSWQFTYANTSKLPSTLDVGLFFKNSAKATLNLKNPMGFFVRQHAQSGQKELMYLANTELILRKDTYYLGSGANYVEYTGPVKEKVGQQTLQGPYHLQIGNTYPNITEAEKVIEATSLQEKPYIAYENGWRVFVGLYIDEATSQARAEAIKAKIGQEVTIVPPSTNRVQVLDNKGNIMFMYDAREAIYFKALEDKGSIPLINVEGKQYRGEITIKRFDNSDMTVINRITLDEYLYGVVSREMSPSWPLEALKAQAVAARGFAVTSMGKYESIGFNLCNTVNSQVYGGYDVEDARTNRAVDETKSRILTYNGNPITPFYHSNSGGQTENSENIWSTPLPYIRGVKDHYSLNAPNSSWTVVKSKDEIKANLEKNDIKIGEPIKITVTERSVNGRILTLVVQGTKGTETMTKEKSRRVFGLKSAWFEVALEGGGTSSVKSSTGEGSVNIKGASVMTASGLKNFNNSTNINLYNGKNYKEIQTGPEVFSFQGKGYGHGLGMSQYGAKKMAEMNLTYDQILTHYYTGVKVELR